MYKHTCHASKSRVSVGHDVRSQRKGKVYRAVVDVDVMINVNTKSIEGTSLEHYGYGMQSMEKKMQGTRLEDGNIEVRVPVQGGSDKYLTFREDQVTILQPEDPAPFLKNDYSEEAQMSVQKLKALLEEMLQKEKIESENPNMEMVIYTKREPTKKETWRDNDVIYVLSKLPLTLTPLEINLLATLRSRTFVDPDRNVLYFERHYKVNDKGSFVN